MQKKKTYWKSEIELDKSSEWIDNLKNKEFAHKLPEDTLNDKELPDSETSRRDFLKYVGFSTAAVSLAACEGPVNKSIPYVFQPEQIIPGISNYYATTLFDGFDMTSVLVKTREGRPIKIENNNDAPVFNCSNARTNASVLSLYDSLRLKNPKFNGEDISWDLLINRAKKQLIDLKNNNEKLALVTSSYPSPTTKKIINDFIDVYPNVSHYYYDAISQSAALNAFEKAYNVRALPAYDFTKAKCIVSVGADFLGDWNGGGFDTDYAKMRIPKGKKGNAKMSKHFQFESNMTLSGANADYRYPTNSFEQKLIISAIYSELSSKNYPKALNESFKKVVKSITKELRKFGKNSIIITGIEDEDTQRCVLAINNILGSEVLVAEKYTQIRQGNPKSFDKLIDDINSGEISGVILSGINPVYTYYDSKKIISGLKKLKFSMTFTMKEDETSVHSQWVAPCPHSLESWGDFELRNGIFGLTQPTIKNIFDTRQFQDVLLDLAEIKTTYYDEIKLLWTNTILNGTTFEKALHDGFFIKKNNRKLTYSDNVNEVVKRLPGKKNNTGLELHLYSKTGIGDGQQANNPWLQEFPDPISRVTWDNYLTISKTDASNLGLKNINQSDGALDGSIALINLNGIEEKVPVLIQPGQAVGTVGLAFGYGRTKGVKEEMQIGVNAYSFYKQSNPIQIINVKATDEFHEFACTQLQNTLIGRDEIVRESTLEIFNTKDKKYWNPMTQVSRDHKEIDVTSEKADMWQAFDRSWGHHFNLSIDLNACTGCGACVIACHAENNVPVVGKREIRKSRDMHWLRIDRYYSSENTFEGDIEKVENSSDFFVRKELENPSENPQVTFQPIMCQHCNHAPCETVCPVAASVHGRQGQNHMTYNRCIGTRYCANNCPYKVRRFNWFLYNKNDEFDYHMNDDLGRMVLNPDVVVRSRGVMEKCSLCIQMTQKTILDAKLEGRQIKDGEFQTACSSACGSGAMVFGDVNDKDSKVNKLRSNDRMYRLLESVGTEPNVMYQTKVRNTKA